MHHIFKKNFPKLFFKMGTFYVHQCTKVRQSFDACRGALSIFFYKIEQNKFNIYFFTKKYILYIMSMDN